MEEADKILITSLRQLGVTVQSLGDFDAQSYITCIILCLERLSKVVEERDNFIDMKFLKKQKVTEATSRYKICQKFVDYLKQLGYPYDTSLNNFLYPNVKETRKMLGYLIDMIF